MNIYMIVLAGGKGTRMKCDIPKCLYPFHYKPMINYLINASQKTKVAVISVGHNDGFEIINKRDNFNFVENIKSVAIEMRKIFKKENAQVIIRNKKCNVIGRIGLNYSVIDISDIDDIELTDEVFVSENLLKINSQIRREYI